MPTKRARASKKKDYTYGKPQIEKIKQAVATRGDGYGFGYPPPEIEAARRTGKAHLLRHLMAMAAQTDGAAVWHHLFEEMLWRMERKGRAD